ncbi:hypothetical protein ACQKNS_25230 [Peribacillus sp. NPDC094092]|uniref:hypothetical protein n=1 Tax=Peribacillus sp. NPDC094092 TaxID=3390611 RepID=UPI003D0238FB
MSKLKKYLFSTFSITFLSWGMIAVYTQIKNIPFGSSIALYILYILGGLQAVFLLLECSF